MSIPKIKCHYCGKPGSIDYGGPDSEPLEHACEECRTHFSYKSAFWPRENKMRIILDKVGVVRYEQISTVRR